MPYVSQMFGKLSPLVLRNIVVSMWNSVSDALVENKIFIEGNKEEFDVFAVSVLTRAKELYPEIGNELSEEIEKMKIDTEQSESEQKGDVRG